MYARKEKLPLRERVKCVKHTHSPRFISDCKIDLTFINDASIVFS